MNVVVAQRRRVGIITCAAGYVSIPGICFAFTFFHQLQVVGLSHYTHRRYIPWQPCNAAPAAHVPWKDRIPGVLHNVCRAGSHSDTESAFILEGGDSVAMVWGLQHPLQRVGPHAGRQRVSHFACTVRSYWRGETSYQRCFDREMEPGIPSPGIYIWKAHD
jgi:hypothetical protein